MRKSRLGATLAMALMAGSAFNMSSGAASLVSEARATQAKQGERGVIRTVAGVDQAMRHLFGGGTGGRHSYPNGPGWTQAKVQRMARKRRNVLRNKRAHRG